jgi:hypothetical protein
VAELSPDERDAALGQLARHLHRWHLGGAAQVLFGVGQGASIFDSHLLLFMQPLLPAAPLRQSVKQYAIALEDEASWQALIEHLKALES